MLRIIFWIILVLGLTLFVVFNVEPKVTVHLLPGVSLEGMPLALVIMVSFLLGLLFGLLILFPQIIRARLRENQLTKELQGLKTVKPEDKENAKDSPNS